MAEKFRDLDQIEREAPPVPEYGGGAMAFYSVYCCWWTSDQKDLRSTSRPIPHCPFCGSPLMQAPLKSFLKSAREVPSHYGPNGLRTLAAAHHGTGQHGKKWHEYNPPEPRNQSNG